MADFTLPMPPQCENFVDLPLEAQLPIIALIPPGPIGTRLALASKYFLDLIEGEAQRYLRIFIEKEVDEERERGGWTWIDPSKQFSRALQSFVETSEAFDFRFVAYDPYPIVRDTTSVKVDEFHLSTEPRLFFPLFFNKV